MRKAAQAAGLPPPTDADYEAAGIGLMPPEEMKARALANSTTPEQRGLRLCAQCHIDLDVINAPLTQDDPGWCCLLSRCRGPLTKTDVANKRGDEANA